MNQLNNRRRMGQWAAAAGLLAAGAVAGGVLASSLSASAATNDAASGPGYGSGQGMRDPGGAQPMRSDEKPVSSADEARLRAAALKAVPGGTIIRIESDAGDGAYEAHMTKADGTLVTVKFDKSLAVTKVEDGMGTGDPAMGPGGPDGDR